MSVGAGAGSGSVDQNLTALAVSIRDWAAKVVNLFTWINGQGNGIAVLEAIGYSGTPNASNPGGVSDAQLASNMISYLNTVAQIYMGTVAQTPAFNFNQELSQLWAGNM